MLGQFRVYLFLILFATCLPAQAKVEHAIGGQLVYTFFDDTSQFGGNTQFIDDSDLGMGGYYRARWGALTSFKVGYMNHGEYSYRSNQQEITSETTSAYLAWAPFYKVDEMFDLELTLGFANYERDNNDGRTFDEDAMIFMGAAHYRYHKHLNLGIEAGTTGTIFGGVNPKWFGLKVAYVF